MDTPLSADSARRRRKVAATSAVLAIPILLVVAAISIRPGWSNLLAAAPTETPSAAAADASYVDIVPSVPRLYFAVEKSFTIPDGRIFHNEDVVEWDGHSLRLAFDGSDVGLAGNKLTGLAVISPTEMLMSLAIPVQLPGIDPVVQPTDVVKFSATRLGRETMGHWQLHLHGKNVGLNEAGEHIDAIEQLPDGTLLLSTVSSFHVPGVDGHDEDLLAFLPKRLGLRTGGTWDLYLDGSDVEWKGQDLDAVCIDPQERLCLSPNEPFTLSVGRVRSCDLLAFTPLSVGAVTTGTYAPRLAFRGDDAGLSQLDVKAIDFGILQNSSPSAGSSPADGTASAK